MSDDVVNESPQLSLLLIDDEANILNALKRLLRKEYSIVTFTNGHEALAYLAENPIDIIMSDMRMPEMDGAEFLTKSREIHPNAVRLLLTGYSDMESTITAINEGGVYTYIGKPWENEELKLTLAKAAENYSLKKQAKTLTDKLATANNELATVNDDLATLNESLEEKVNQRTAALNASKQKLTGTLNIQKELLHDVLDMMSATIEYRTGYSTGHIKRIAAQSRGVAQLLGLDRPTCRRVYLCALLHEIGTVGLKDDVLANIKLGSEKLDDSFASHPVIGAEIVGKVKRFSSLIGSIKHQNENFDGTGVPDHLSGDDIPIGARIIRVVKDFDFLIAGKDNAKKMSVKNAEAWIKDKADTWYDRNVMKVFMDIIAKRSLEDDSGIECSVGLETLKAGDMLLEDLVLHNGNTMLKAGQEVNRTIIEKLREYEENYNTKVTLFIA